MQPPTQDPVLRLCGVTKTYAMGEILVHALRGVDLELRRGELLVLLGPSGSGKSTMLNILGALDTPTTGRVLFGDEELTGAGRDRLTEFRRRHVGFVFQFYNLIPSLTARENVKLVTDIADRPMEAAAALELVGLSARRDHFPAQLSGGEQAGGQVYAQALLWSRTGGIWLLPNEATNAATITLRGYQTTGPQFPFGPGEQLHLIVAAGTPPARAVIGAQFGVPSRYFVELEVDPPTTGYDLRIGSVAHRGSFTRVLATLVPPSPGQPVRERLRPLRERALLGVWIGTIEVDLRLGTRPQASAIGPVIAR